MRSWVKAIPFTKNENNLMQIQNVNFLLISVCLIFNKEWMGDVISHSSDMKTYTIVNKQHTGIQHNGNQLQITVFCE